MKRLKLHSYHSPSLKKLRLLSIQSFTLELSSERQIEIKELKENKTSQKIFFTFAIKHGFQHQQNSSDRVYVFYRRYAHLT